MGRERHSTTWANSRVNWKSKKTFVSKNRKNRPFFRNTKVYMKVHTKVSCCRKLLITVFFFQRLTTRVWSHTWLSTHVFEHTRIWAQTWFTAHVICHPWSCLISRLGSTSHAINYPYLNPALRKAKIECRSNFGYIIKQSKKIIGPWMRVRVRIKGKVMNECFI